MVKGGNRCVSNSPVSLAPKGYKSLDTCLKGRNSNPVGCDGSHRYEGKA